MSVIEQTARRSRELFEAGYYCAESVLLAVAVSRGIRSEGVPRIATGFCSGLARTGGMCGALSGAVMGLGLGTGRVAPNQSVAQNYAQVQSLRSKFKARFGATSCQELLGCDPGTVEGQAIFRSNKLAEKCKGFTEGATEIAMSLIAQTDLKQPRK